MYIQIVSLVAQQSKLYLSVVRNTSSLHIM